MTEMISSSHPGRGPPHIHIDYIAVSLHPKRLLVHFLIFFQDPPVSFQILILVRPGIVMQGHHTVWCMMEFQSCSNRVGRDVAALALGESSFYTWDT